MNCVVQGQGDCNGYTQNGLPLPWTQTEGNKLENAVMEFHRYLRLGGEVPLETVIILAGYTIYFAQAPRWWFRTRNEKAIEFGHLITRIATSRTPHDLRDALIVLAFRFHLNPFRSVIAVPAVQPFKLPTFVFPKNNPTAEMGA